MQVRQGDAPGHPEAAGHDGSRVVRAEVALPGTMSAVATARAAVREIVGRWGYRDEECVQLAELIASELVANAVRHAGSTSILTVSADRNTVTLTVRDESP